MATVDAMRATYPMNAMIARGGLRFHARWGGANPTHLGRVRRRSSGFQRQTFATVLGTLALYSAVRPK